MIDAETELVHLCNEFLESENPPTSLLEEMRHYLDVALRERDLER